MVDFSKIKEISIKLTDAVKSENNAPKGKAAEDLWGEIGNEVTESLKAQGNSEEDSKALASRYINYASETMKEDKDGKGTIDFEEWSSNKARYDWLGIDTSDPEKAKAELKEIYDSVAGLDGKDGLSAKELVSLVMYTDAMNSKTKDDKANLDGDTKSEDATDVNKTGQLSYSELMKTVKNEEGKKLIDELYASTFRTETYIRQAGDDLKAAFAENVNNGQITQEEVNKIATGLTDYLTATMKQKDIDSSTGISRDEWLRDGTGTYSALGLVDEKGNNEVAKGEELFSIIDLDGNGVLDINELATQYMYRDATSQAGKLVNPSMEAVDGSIHIDGNGGIARNLTTLLNMEGTVEEKRQFLIDNFGANFGFLNADGTPASNPASQTTQTGGVTGAGATNTGNTTETGSTGENKNNVSERAQAAYDALYDAEEGFMNYQWWLDFMPDWGTQGAEYSAHFSPNTHKGVNFISENALSGDTATAAKNYTDAALDLAKAYMNENDTEDASGKKDNVISYDEFENALANRLRKIYGNVEENLDSLTNAQIFDKYGVSPRSLFSVYNVNSADDVLDMTEIAMSYISADVSTKSSGTNDLQAGNWHFDGNINVTDMANLTQDEYDSIYNTFFPKSEQV